MNQDSTTVATMYFCHETGEYLNPAEFISACLVHELNGGVKSNMRKFQEIEVDL